MLMSKHLHLALCIFSLTLAVNVSGEEKTDTKSNDNEKTIKASVRKNSEEQPNNTVRLESVFVGDKEQPAISYFIPWQGIGTPDKLHWNVEEKHDQALDLVDREIMLRSIHFYEEMHLENPTEATEQ